MGAALDSARRGARLTGATITTSLNAIIFTTRASAKALARIHRCRARLNKLGTKGNHVAVKAALALVERDYQRPQANPRR